MKRYLPLLAAMLISAFTYSQITITGADLPSSGKGFILGNDAAPTVSLGSPSSSQQTWNFSALANSYPKAAVYDSTSSTAYSGQFPTSNIYTYGPAQFFGLLYGGAPVPYGDMGYTFWKSDSSGLRVIGWEEVTGQYAHIPVYENPAELLIGTPATYGSTFADTSRWTMTLGGVGVVDTTWVTYRTKTLTVDAWGSLTIPFGTFPNVLRMHENVTETDSVIATLNSTVLLQIQVKHQTTNNYMYLANGVGYPVATVRCDSANNMNTIEYIMDTSCAVYSQVMGSIANDSGHAIDSGLVYLYQYIDSLTPMQLVDSTVIDSNGFYTFLYITGGNYIISAQASLSICPLCIPTWSGNVNVWVNGTRFDSYCLDTVTTNIILTQLTQMTGNGTLSGLIMYGLGFFKNQSNTVPSASILLEQLPGGIKAHTTSDASGNYSFSHVPPGTYTITVDVPGLPMKSTDTVTVTSQNLTFPNLNFTIDTTARNGGIYAGYPLSVTEVSLGDAQVRAYPNPSVGQFNIAVESFAPGLLEIKIYNTLGQLVYADNAANPSGTISQSIHTGDLAAGIYTLQLSTGNDIVTRKVVLQK
jgi:hypothetical protein